MPPKKKASLRKKQPTSPTSLAAEIDNMPPPTLCLRVNIVTLGRIPKDFIDICRSAVEKIANVLSTVKGPIGPDFIIIPTDRIGIRRFIGGKQKLAGVTVRPKLVPLESAGMSDDSDIADDDDLLEALEDAGSSFFEDSDSSLEAPPRKTPTKKAPTQQRPPTPTTTSTSPPAVPPPAVADPAAAGSPAAAVTDQLSSRAAPASYAEAAARGARPTTRFAGRPLPKFRGVDLSTVQITVNRPATKTVLVRPTNDASLRKVNQRKLATSLAALGPVSAVRDIRRGGIAVDLPETEDLSPFLAVTDLVGVPVKASLPAGTTTSKLDGVIHGVHPDITNDQLLSELAPFGVAAVQRLAKPGQTSWVVKLRFSSVLPSTVTLFYRSHKVRPYVDRPLQCDNCSRFGHVAKVCRSSPRCRVCGKPHVAADCPETAQPRCANCGGSHVANHPSCPTRAFQTKVSEVRLSFQVPFKVARKAVVEAVRSHKQTQKTPARRDEREQQPELAVTRQTTTSAAAPVTTQTPDLSGLFTALAAVMGPLAPAGHLTTFLEAVAGVFKAFSPGFQAPPT